MLREKKLYQEEPACCVVMSWLRCKSCSWQESFHQRKQTSISSRSLALEIEYSKWCACFCWGFLEKSVSQLSVKEKVWVFPINWGCTPELCDSNSYITKQITEFQTVWTPVLHVSVSFHILILIKIQLSSKFSNKDICIVQ